MHTTDSPDRRSLATLPGVWSYPDANKVLPHDAPRDVWLAERAKGIGGSDAAAVLGFNTWTSPREVYYDKRGMLAPKPQTHAMLFGTLLEDGIAEGFKVLTGLDTRRCGLLRSKKWPWMQVSVDRLTSDGGGLEIKNMGYFRADEWGDEDNPEIPDAAHLQAMHCMAVTGKTHWWIMGLLGGSRPVIRRIERNDKTIAQIVELERIFWVNHVQAAVPPPVDGSEACGEVLKKIYNKPDPDQTAVVDKSLILELLEEEERVKANKKAAQAEVDTFVNKLRDIAGNAVAVTFPGNDGKLPDPVFTLLPNGVFGSKVFKAVEPELAERYTRPITQTKLDTAALKADHPEIYAQYRARPVKPTKFGLELLERTRAAQAATHPQTEKKDVA